MQVLRYPRYISRACQLHRSQRTFLFLILLLFLFNLFICLVLLDHSSVILLQVLIDHWSLPPSGNRSFTHCMTSPIQGFRPHRSWLLHVLYGRTCRVISRFGHALTSPARGPRSIVTPRLPLVSFCLQVSVFNMSILTSSVLFRLQMVALTFSRASTVSLAGRRLFLSPTLLPKQLLRLS